MNSTNASTSLSTEQWYPYFIPSFLLMLTVAAVGNILVMIAYWITPSLQTPPNILIFNLSLVDSLVAVSSLPWMIFNFTQIGLDLTTTHKWACMTALFLTLANSTASMIGLLFLSMERFIACIFPFTYYNVVTERSTKVANVMTWVLSFILHIIPFFGLDVWKPGVQCFSMYVINPLYNSYVSSGLRTIILIITAVVNIVVCIVAFKKQRVSVADHVPNDPKGLTSDFKLTKMLLTVVGVFFLCWAPFLALNTLFTMRRGNVANWVECLYNFCTLGIGLNSALNPLIYARKDKKFRSAFKRILCRKSVENFVMDNNGTASSSIERY